MMALIDCNIRMIMASVLVIVCTDCGYIWATARVLQFNESQINRFGVLYTSVCGLYTFDALARGTSSGY